MLPEKLLHELRTQAANYLYINYMATTSLQGINKLILNPENNLLNWSTVKYT